MIFGAPRRNGRNSALSVSSSFDSRFDEYIQRYVNSYGTLSKAMEQAKNKKIDKDNRMSMRTKTKWTVLKDLGFTKLPLVSTSEESRWAIEYATALVNWNKQKHTLRKVGITPLIPDYSLDGHPKHPYLGIVYVTLHFG